MNKKTHHLERKYAIKGSILKSLFVTMAVWLGLGLGEFLGLTRPFIVAVQKVFLPTEQVIAQVVLRLKLSGWQVKESWQAEQALVKLRQEHTELLARVAKLEAVQAENQALRKMLENTDRKLTPAVLAAPIISFAQPAIAVGSQVGVKPGMMVLANDQLLGFVGQVEANQSEVLLVSGSGIQPILAKTDGGVMGLVQSDGHQLLLKEVPPDAAVKVGEKVTTIGQNGVTPHLFIATVSKVENLPAASTQTIWLQQPTSFFNVAIVEVK